MFTGFRTTRFHICPSESPLVTGLWSLFVWLITLQNVARKSGPGSKKMVHRSAKYGSIFCRVVNKCGSIISTLALIKTWFRHRYGPITSRGFDVVNAQSDSDCGRSRFFLKFIGYPRHLLGLWTRRKMWLVGQCAAPVGASSRGSSRWDAFPRASNIYKSNAIPSR